MERAGKLEVILARFLSHQPSTPRREVVRAALGVALGLGVTALLSTASASAAWSAPLLVAPMGASAVLLFAVPASPLAQPHAFLGGNLLAALIGVTAAKLLPFPIAAAPLAVAITVAAMALCRCIHPPSGAVALVAVLGGPHVLASGYMFVVSPVMLNSLMLFLAALAWNNFTGRSYPHVAHPVAIPVPTIPAPVSLADCEAVIAAYGETLSIEPTDLKVLHEALSRRT